LTTPQAAYAAGFLEGSLGLAPGSLRAEDVPSDFVAELSSVLRGTPPKDSATPSLETQVMEILAEMERSSVERDGFFVRKARWPHAAPLAVCLTHDVDNIERPREHIEKVKAEIQKAASGRSKPASTGTAPSADASGSSAKQDRENQPSFLSSLTMETDL